MATSMASPGPLGPWRALTWACSASVTATKNFLAHLHCTCIYTYIPFHSILFHSIQSIPVHSSPYIYDMIWLICTQVYCSMFFNRAHLSSQRFLKHNKNRHIASQIWFQRFSETDLKQKDWSTPTKAKSQRSTLRDNCKQMVLHV